jgi:hypothetical protein
MTQLDAIPFNYMLSMTVKIPGLEVYVDTSTKTVHDDCLSYANSMGQTRQIL